MKKENIELESIEKQVPPSSKILNQVAEPVDVKDIKSPEIQKLISKLLIVAKGVKEMQTSRHWSDWPLRRLVFQKEL